MLQRTLEAAGVQVWRDRANLWPGENWRVKIRDAITHDALVFTACFSSHSAARQKSYQNEELMLAIDQLRLRRPDDPWLIPVCFDNCDVPDLELGAGRTLASIQRADLFGEGYDQAVARLVRTVLRILGSRHGASPATGVPAPIAADSRHRPAEPVPKPQLDVCGTRSTWAFALIRSSVLAS